MAASAPPPHHLTAGWVDNQQSSSSSSSPEEDAESKDLELKMSGMSLMTNYNNSGSAHPPPAMSCSTVSTSSVEGGGPPHHHHPHHPNNRSNDSSIDHSSAAGSSHKTGGSFSTPSSPTNPAGHHHHQQQQHHGFSRPPGLGGHNVPPSPLGGPGGHSKNSSTTSAMLTLTPNSSVDGNSDLYSLGGTTRQPSPPGPAIPFLRSHNDGIRRGGGDNDSTGGGGGDYGGGLTTFGSFDLVESDNDGLLGLDALRDRAYSSPGPMARSFESAPSLSTRPLPPASSSRGGGGGDAGPEGRRLRGVSRDNSGRSSSSARPPLSGGNNAAHSPRGDHVISSSGDVSLGGLVVPFPGGGGGSRSGDPSPTRPSQQQQQQQEPGAADLRGFGSLGRPELSGNSQEWEPLSRRRSIAGTNDAVHVGGGGGHADYSPRYSEYHHEYEHSRRRSIGTTDGGREYQQYSVDSYNQPQQQQPLIDPTIAQKFGSMPSLNSHLQQQRMTQQQQQQQQIQQQQQQQQYMANPMMIPQPRHQRSFSQPGPVRVATTPPDSIGGGGSMEGGSLGRYPDMNDPGHYQPRVVQDPPRYIGAPPPPPQSHHVRTPSGDSYRSGGSRRSASMSHGSLSHGSYDGSATNMPSQKRNSQPNLGTGYYGQSSLPSMHQTVQRMNQSEHDHHRRHTYDDDLAGTLLGEHIEVPADHGLDDGYGGYGLGEMRPQMMVPPEQINPYSFETAHAHLPTAGAALPSPKVVYNVKFKRTQRSFVLGPRIQRDLKVGTYVKVEADRGEDLGIVIGKVTGDKYGFSARSSFRSPTDMIPSPTSLSPPGATDLKCIIRLATHDEVSLLAMKREEEEELLKICRGKVRQRALQMNVVDAEYQFDRHKLTFFFEAEGRIDFRELVRDLFSMYKTRIWMQQLDKNSTTAGGTGVSPPPSTMIDYGTPIIAPASEFSDTYAMNGLAGS